LPKDAVASSKRSSRPPPASAAHPQRRQAQSYFGCARRHRLGASATRVKLALPERTVGGLNRRRQREYTGRGVTARTIASTRSVISTKPPTHSSSAPACQCAGSPSRPTDSRQALVDQDRFVELASSLGVARKRSTGTVHETTISLPHDLKTGRPHPIGTSTVDGRSSDSDGGSGPQFWPRN